jgi:leader peptidase (prepilin peptidase)/N-methyltransferase
LSVLLAAVIGLLLGQALDLAFNRLYTDQPLDAPVQRCPACGRAPRLRHLVPLVGVAWDRGRCPGCGRWLPLRAFLLAPGAAALFAAAQLTIDGFGPALLAGFFATVFLALTFTDLERRLLPNRVVYPAIALAAALSWAWPHVAIGQAIGGGLFALVIVSLLYVLSRGALGFGDVKMSVLMGLVVGFPSVLVGIFAGVLAAGAFVLPLLLLRVLSRRDYIAYGPFIAIGAIIALFWGDSIWDWYTDR